MGMTEESQGNNEIVEDTELPPGRTEAEDEDDAHPAGIYRMLAVIGAMVLFGLVPYVVPGLDQFRVWQEGDSIPFTGLFNFQPPVRPPAIAGGGRTEQAPRDEGDLLAAVPLPAARPTHPLRSAPQGADGGASRPAADAGPAREPPAPRIDPRHYEGLTRELEEFTGHEMDYFYGQLAAVGRGEAGTLARMSVFSVSTNGADRVSSAIRQGLQEIFGDGGKGWVPLSPGWTYQAHRDVEWSYFNWNTCVVNRGRCPDERPGYGGVLASNAGVHSSATFGTMDQGPSNREMSLVRVYYQAWQRGGEMSLLVDGEERARLPLASEVQEDRVHELRMPRGAHEVTVQVGEGRLRVYGVTLENDGPGVVVDGVMLIGASVRVGLNFDETHIATQVRQREPDLLIFWLGGNDVISRFFTPDRFREDYDELIRRFQAGRPEASCLVVSVLDMGQMEEGRIRTRAYVGAVVDTQEQVARDRGCAFFNLYEATGGRGTMNRWYNSNPRLAVSDYSHLTEIGARVVGTLIRRALLKSYDDWLAGGGS
jgi:lysophospholipase L1-like esterase